MSYIGCNAEKVEGMRAFSNKNFPIIFTVAFAGFYRLGDVAGCAINAAQGLQANCTNGLQIEQKKKIRNGR